MTTHAVDLDDGGGALQRKAPSLHCLQLYFRVKLLTLWSCDRLDANLRDVQHAMTSRILTYLDAITATFVEYDESRGHEVMATLLDPRFCMGDIFITSTTGTCTEERNCGRAPKVVM
jgi:hypothetical protein